MSHKLLTAAGIAALCLVSYLLFVSNISASEYKSGAADMLGRFIPLPELDTKEYDRRLLKLAHIPLSTTTTPSLQVASSTPGRLYPVKAPYPKFGAILPFKRVIAYYGNFYSTKMGVLGEYEPDVMLQKLRDETAAWEAADPTTPVVPAIHYIAAVAQGTAGREGKYILRMPDEEIDKALDLARQVDGVVFLDIQVALSNLQYELPLLEKYLSMPQVHLGIDPEFSMKGGEKPGTVIGTFDAADINYAAEYLAKLVKEHDLPPKILVIHRFTQRMVTNYDKIKTMPEVQFVIHMDGWGSQAKKKGTYRYIVAPEPVQFTGIKIFYHTDLRPPSTGLLTKQEVLDLEPTPIYIQYQ